MCATIPEASYQCQQDSFAFYQRENSDRYICHKTGPGHSDFSEPYPVYLEPSNHLRWQNLFVC